ncbi:MAG: hypothetical protein IKH43_05165 [Bacteroidaceae bacterium]|nr:hypothetical protein [Bacteroidaceae bacterium]
MTKYKDTDLHEALRRRYANTPQMPTDFTERMMEQMNTKPSHRPHWWYWLPAAACLLIVVGIGLHYELDEASRSIVQPSAHSQSTERTQPVNRVQPTEQLSATNHSIECSQPVNRVQPVIQSGTANRKAKRTRSTVNPDTLGNEIWHNPENVERAIRILADCKATIQREEQEMRNMVIKATFHATPQPANAVLVTNEVGDYEVIETKRIVEI